MAKEKKVASTTQAELIENDPGSSTEPQPAAVPEYQAMEPVTPDHVMAWKCTTSGLEDYAMWRQMLKDQKLDGDPPFRRGRIWA
jgi:cyanobactin cluster PatC/TenC/TruC protein